MRQGVRITLLLICLLASACGDDDGSPFDVATTSGGGETFATTQATSATTATTSTSTSTTTTSTTIAAETTVTTAPVQLGPTCTNIAMGYTISYPVGWHVDGEDIDWNAYPSDDLSCRLYGPSVFVDPGVFGQEGLIASSAQAIVTLHTAPDVGFGAVLLSRDLGYLSTAELLTHLQTQYGLTVTDLGNAAMPTWKVEGWMGAFLVYGYVIEPWADCHPLEIGTSSTDEALVAEGAPIVDAMLAGFAPQAVLPAACMDY